MSVTVKNITQLKDIASKDVLVAAGGVGAGGMAGEYLGEMAKTSLAQTGWAGVGVKALVKSLLALLMGIISRGQAGITKIFLVLSGLGSMATILPDIIGMVYPGGAVAGGQIAGLKLRELSLGAKALAPTTTTTTNAGVLTGQNPPTVDYAGDGNSGVAPSAITPTRAKVTDFAGR